MRTKTDLYQATKKILKEVRFGNLSSRLSIKHFPCDVEFVNDFNNMLEAVIDREKMINEYQNYILDQSEHLKSLFNMLNEGAMTLSEDFKIITINDLQTKWFRKHKKDLVGDYIFDVLKNYTIREFPSNRIKVNYRKFFEKDRKNYKLSFELKKIRMTFNISVKKYFDKDGKQNYFIVAKDITADVNLQKLKDTFIATLTHDLKVPILAEAKVLDLLKKETFGKNSEAQKQAFANMISNNKDMMALVTTLLDVHKLDDGVYIINVTEADIEEIVKKEVDRLKFLLTENNCEIKIEISTKLPKIKVDAKEIGRVVKNILTNAINFSPENSFIYIKLFSDNNNLYIEITDNGCGIEPKDIPYIFDRYFTIAKKYRKVGTGLGLYLCKKIVDLHNGNISVKSIMNKETTFKIELPIK